MIENPPWVTKALNKHWAQLEELVGRELMPVNESTSKGKITPQEYGSGHYGTVMPAEDGHSVVKITSDPTEAVFVAAALSIGKLPHGLVKYSRIVALPEKHKGRPVFVLWRQEASEVGFLAGSRLSRQGAGGYDAITTREAVNYIGDFLTMASVIRNSMKSSGNEIVEKAKALEDWAFGWVAERYDLIGARDPQDPWRNKASQAVTSYLKGPQRVAAALRFLEVIAESMHHNNPITTDIGAAFEFYMEHGIIMADVHTNNIGKVTIGERDDQYETPAITDPGHAVFLTNQYDSVSIPTLGE
jgi:hypothetical protein